jgi:hypothetical protein
MKQTDAPADVRLAAARGLLLLRAAGASASSGQ